MPRRIFCFGDSNTYGYDPRSPLGERYPAPVRWTGLLDADPRWEVLNCGENGREIPHRPGELDRAEALLARSGAPDAAVVMLGSNDLLQNPSFTAEDVTARMEVFLRRLAARAGSGTKLLLVAPPPMVPGVWVGEERLPVQSARLGDCFCALARRLGIVFADAGAWNVALVFDGVHFSMEGHRAFAAGLVPVLEGLFGKPADAGEGSEANGD